jgi:outer membrane biosynthesis protein TonB
VRARAFAAALAFSVSLIGGAAAQDPPPEVDAPHLPPEAPKSPSITAVPLPDAPPPSARPAPAEKRSPAPVVVEKPKAVAQPKAEPSPVPAAAPKPTAECVIKPVMTDDDLRACGARR